MKTSPFALRIETLEARIAPAMVTTFAGGLLTITGDDGPNALTITEGNGPGAYLLDGVVVGNTVSAQDVTGILVKLGAGNDDLTLEGNAAAGSALKKGLTVTSSGTLDLTITDHAGILGTLAVTHTSANALSIVIQGSSTSIGALAIKDGEGSSNLTFSSFGTVKGITITDGVGAGGTVSLNGVSVGGALNITAGGATSSINLQSQTLIGGAVAVKYPGLTESSLNIQGNTEIFGKLTVSGGAGNHGVTVNAAQFFASAALALGDGTNAVEVTNGLFGGALSIAGGTGPADVDLSNTDVFGALTVNLPKASIVTVDLFDGVFAGPVSVTSGPGVDVLNIEAVTVSGGITANLGKGSNLVSLKTLITGGSVVLGSLDQISNINANGLQIGGTFIAHAGAANAIINLLASTFGTLNLTAPVGGNFLLDEVTVRGKTTLKTAAGNDSVQITNSRLAAFSFDAGAGDNLLQIEPNFSNNSVGSHFGGVFSYKGGAGVDTITLGLDADDRVRFIGPASFSGGGGVNTINDDFAATLLPFKLTAFTLV